MPHKLLYVLKQSMQTIFLIDILQITLSGLLNNLCIGIRKASHNFVFAKAINADYLPNRYPADYFMWIAQLPLYWYTESLK